MPQEMILLHPFWHLKKKKIAHFLMFGLTTHDSLVPSNFTCYPYVNLDRAACVENNLRKNRSPLKQQYQRPGAGKRGLLVCWESSVCVTE